MTVVRPAELDDVPRMMELEREAATAAHWTEQNYRAIFTEATPRRFALVVSENTPSKLVNGRQPVLGFIVTRCADWEWEIENLVVEAASSRKGCGSLLVGELLKMACAEGASALELEVRSTNSGAIEFYGRFGFKQSGCRKFYYSNPLEDALLLRLEITAATPEKD